MIAWNFNMDEAPRGEWRAVERMVGKELVTINKHFPTLVIAAGSGGVVTLSRWLPEEGRWNMFTKHVPPIAWMPWPDHPTQPNGETK